MTAPYGRPFRRRRLEVLERDGYRCQLRLRPGCRGVANVVDHVDNNPANNDPANLRAACSWCNATRANRRRARRGPGLLTSSSLNGPPRAVP